MPTTWTAQKIHCLTQPERRALCRVITRRHDRALFLVHTVWRGASIVWRVTLVLLHGVPHGRPGGSPRCRGGGASRRLAAPGGVLSQVFIWDVFGPPAANARKFTVRLLA